MIELFWIGLTAIAVAVALLNGALPSHPVDFAVTLPVIPVLGVVGSFLMMRLYLADGLSIQLIVRYVLASLVGLGLVSAALIQFSPHLGSGGLGAFALHLLYWAGGAAATAGGAIYFLLRFFRG